MKATEFLRLPPTTPPDRLYVITGEDSYLQRACVQALRQRVIPEESLWAFNYSEHDLGQEALSRVLAVAQELPLPPTGRLVVVRNLDRLADTDVERLKDYVRRPA
ncbi:MAG: hypothetical protein SNJ62_07570, partial [Chloracidobacterium sp.]